MKWVFAGGTWAAAGNKGVYQIVRSGSPLGEIYRVHLVTQRAAPRHIVTCGGGDNPLRDAKRAAAEHDDGRRQ